MIEKDYIINSLRRGGKPLDILYDTPRYLETEAAANELDRQRIVRMFSLERGGFRLILRRKGLWRWKSLQENQEMNTKSIEGKTLYRSATFERSAIDEKNRTVQLAFSSEQPFSRWFGIEILDHAQGSVDLERLNNGAPLLVDHSTSDHVGTIMQVVVGSDKIGRALVKFGNSTRATEVFQDVIDGIRSKCSVGYRVNKMILEETSGDSEEDTYRVTSWTPFEISLTAIAADDTVGVGRSENLNLKRRITVENDNDKKTGDQKRVQEITEILAIGQQYKMDDIASRAVQNGTTLDEFRQIILEKVATSKPLSLPSLEDDMSAGERKEYKNAFTDAIRSQIPGQPQNGFVLEVSEELAKRSDRKPQGILVDMGALKERTMVVGTDTSAGYTVQEDLLSGSFIELLRNRILTMKMGANTLPGLRGDVAIPRQATASSGYYVSEDESVTASDPSTGQVTGSPKTHGFRTSLSRKSLLQSSIDMENFVKADHASGHGLAIDLACINGSGVGNEPLGILGTSGIGDVAGGENGLAPAWSHIVDLWAAVATDNADIGSLGFLTNTVVIKKLMTTVKVASTDSVMIVNDFNDMEGFTRLAGSKCGVSNQVPSGLDKGTSTDVCSAIIYGNWADLYVGIWGNGIDVIVDPYTDSAKGQLNITTLLDYDVLIRHAESFAAMQDALTA